VSAGVTSVDKLEAIVHLRILREDVVQKKQLALEQGMMPLVESAAASKERRQPSPAAQIRTHLRTRGVHARERAEEQVSPNNRNGTY